MRILLKASFAAMAFLVASPAIADDGKVDSRAVPKDLAEWAGKIQMNYPAAALRNEEEGTVTMRITIGTDGLVQDCEVTKSSGSAALDEAGCEGMRDFARFTPARDINGIAIPSVTEQSIRYILPDDGLKMHYSNPIPERIFEWRNRVFDKEYGDAIQQTAQKKALYVLIIDETGKAVSCGIMWPSGNAELDRKACSDLLEHARFLPAELDDGTKFSGAFPVPYPSFEALQPN